MAQAAPSFEDIFAFAHLYACAKECCRGVRWKASVQNFEANMLIWCANLHDQLMHGTWKSRGFHRFTICERGKVRHIQSVHISERCIQKCLVRYCLRPLVMPKLISDTYATLPGKGTHAALKRHAEHARRFYRRHGRDGLVQLMDYRDYFGSIDHGILLGMYERLGLDGRTMALLRSFVECFDHGLGLGSEVSQISAVLYVSPIDHLVKDRLGVRCYARYMDDSYIFATAEELREAMPAIRERSAELGLRMNPKVTCAHDLRHGWHWLKHQWALSETGHVACRVERSAVARARSRAERNARLVAAGLMAPESARASEASWEAWRTLYL